VQLARYIHGAETDELLERISSGPDIYYCFDAIGNVVRLADDNGNVLEQYSYDIFGVPTFKDANGNVVANSAYANRFLFTGREYIQETGLYDYRMRVYSPDLGRFLQPDPIGFFTKEYNLYRYAINSPTNLRDPLGFKGNPPQPPVPPTQPP